MVELDEIMRQRGDQQFAQLLCQVRTTECTEEDFDLLKSRTRDPEYPHDSRLNKDVDISKLNRLAPEDQHAIDCTKDKHTRQFDMTMPPTLEDWWGNSTWPWVQRSC